MINRVVLVGRLTKDPDLRYTPSGVAVATFTLAVNRTFSNQQGDREADFINCVIWRKPAENVANFLKKGSLAGVEGRIQTRSYDGQDGKKVYVTEVVADAVQFLEPRNASGNQGGSFGANQNQQNQQGFNAGNPFEAPSGKPSFNDDPFGGTSKTIDITDDDLPF
jgi:single-strand DNA-binding protein